MNNVPRDGRFGEFGGRYVPETLVPALDDLTAAFERAWGDREFQAEFDELLATYVGRPTPLYRARRLSTAGGGATIYLKREDQARGPGAPTEELLAAAEYLAACGNSDILLCERGIRTFETATRNTLDLNAVPALKARSHLPVAVDPSHGTGARDFVASMSRAAVAAGADVVMVEVDVDPDTALSDGAQTLDLAAFEELMQQLGRVAEGVGRALSS